MNLLNITNYPLNCQSFTSHQLFPFSSQRMNTHTCTHSHTRTFTIFIISDTPSTTDSTIATSLVLSHLNNKSNHLRISLPPHTSKLNFSHRFFHISSSRLLISGTLPTNLRSFSQQLPSITITIQSLTLLPFVPLSLSRNHSSLALTLWTPGAG